MSMDFGREFADDITELKPENVPYADIWCFGVPQNRERVLLIANLRSRGRRKILFVTGEGGSSQFRIPALQAGSSRIRKSLQRRLFDCLSTDEERELDDFLDRLTKEFENEAGENETNGQH